MSWWRARFSGSGWRQLTFIFGALLSLSACEGDWPETYDPDDDDGYGTDLLEGLLAASFPTAEVEGLNGGWNSDPLPVASADRVELYLAIGGGLSYSTAEARELLSFVDSGNHALLAAEVVSNRLTGLLGPDTCFTDFGEGYQFDTALHVVAEGGQAFDLPAIRYERSKAMEFTTLILSNQCQGHTRWSNRLALLERYSPGYDDSLGTQQSVLATFVYGRGSVSFLSVPKLLTNVYATDSVARIAIEEAMATIPAVNTVYLDRDRRSSAELVRLQNRAPTVDDGAGNLLKHVLQRPALAAAWYGLLLGSLAFLVLGAKRRQRIIPIVRPRRNTTHEYLGNVSRLYLGHQSNALMADKQLRLFEAYCQRRFGLSPLKKPGDRQRLERTRGVTAELLDTLERYQTSITRNQALSNDAFVRLVTNLQDFYRRVGRRYD